ncbi:hypothetical protein [Acinetobacter pragensis]|uniref:Uncharacterized protein n=1 Tax=Acinetobacter pragensis TaxID=1806892 RepID=A0A151Y5D9_9GAMM|nr:hypothetical protein [Acinetobacter pragensis]KYQ73200.1 hypothetical protein AZH43_07170 [Acinetobacter pragensis]
MNPILSGTEAFNAMMAGKHVICRLADQTVDFDDLDQFPATIFALPDYEFCIKREMLTLAGIQFTKPAEPHDLETGQEIFIVMPTCILRTTYDHEHGDICLSVANGFAQLDIDNAKLQLQAFGKTFGNMITEIEVKDGFNDKPKKRPRKTKAVDSVNIQGATLNDAAAPTETKPAARTAFSIEDVDEIKTDPAQIIEEFTAKINACTSTEAVLGLRPVFFANGHLEREDQQHLCRLTEAKLLELDPEQYASNPEPEELSIEELQRLQIEAEKLVTDNKLAYEAELEYPKLLDDLLQRAANAALPAEATALTGYTKSWTEEQRKPLLDAIHKRLNELNPPESAQVKEPPSLMVQIQNAKDLTELDCLEIEASTRHADIQPKLMGYVKRRRFELENSGSEAAL